MDIVVRERRGRSRECRERWGVRMKGNTKCQCVTLCPLLLSLSSLVL